MKTKKQKNNLNNSNEVLNLVRILFVLLTAIFLILFFSLIKMNYEMKKICDNGYYPDTKSVEVNTNKNVYLNNEKINLTVKNNENQSIYFEPCEYLNNFEKKINGEWRKENAVINNSSYYDRVSFNKNKIVTRCEIELPKSGEGIYRSVVQIYYNCEKPGRCESSEIFYSNEFKIVINSN